MPSISEFAVDQFAEDLGKSSMNIRVSSPPMQPQLRIVKTLAIDIEPVGMPVGGLTKRVLDICVASTALILMTPILIMISALIYITMGRTIFYSQRRVGFDGQMFECFKFRSMQNNADEILAHHLIQCPEARREWEQTQKLRNDPRITWLGNILRKSSLDELPQLFNIIRGDMSCIGPRPVLSKELERYGAHDMEYKRARPGLTGLWQVSGRSNTTYAERINLDRFYVRRWSLALDLNILLRTIPALLKFNETS